MQQRIHTSLLVLMSFGVNRIQILRCADSSGLGSAITLLAVGFVAGAGTTYALSPSQETPQNIAARQQQLYTQAKLINEDEYNSTEAGLSDTLQSNIEKEVDVETRRRQLYHDSKHVESLLTSIKKELSTAPVDQILTQKLEAEQKRLTHFSHHLGKLSVGFATFTEKCIDPSHKLNNRVTQSKQLFGGILTLVQPTQGHKYDATKLEDELGKIHAQRVLQKSVDYTQSLVAVVQELDSDIQYISTTLRALAQASCYKKDSTMFDDARAHLAELKALHAHLIGLHAYKHAAEAHLAEMAQQRAEKLKLQKQMVDKAEAELEAARAKRAAADANERATENLSKAQKVALRIATLQANKDHHACIEREKTLEAAKNSAQQQLQNAQALLGESLKRAETATQKAEANVKEALDRLDTANRGNQYMREALVPKLETELATAQQQLKQAHGAISTLRGHAAQLTTLKEQLITLREEEGAPTKALDLIIARVAKLQKDLLGDTETK